MQSDPFLMWQLRRAVPHLFLSLRRSSCLLVLLALPERQEKPMARKERRIRCVGRPFSATRRTLRRFPPRRSIDVFSQQSISARQGLIHVAHINIHQICWGKQKAERESIRFLRAQAAPLQTLVSHPAYSQTPFLLLPVSFTSSELFVPLIVFVTRRTLYNLRLEISIEQMGFRSKKYNGVIL